jgi:hypothetical protein
MTPSSRGTGQAPLSDAWPVCPVTLPLAAVYRSKLSGRRAFLSIVQAGLRRLRMWFPGGWVPVALGVLALVGCLTAAATARREVDRTGRHVLAAPTAVAGVALCVYSFLFPIMLVSLLFEGAGAGIGASLLATGGGAVAGVLCLRVAVDQRRLAVRSCESCGECMAGRRRAGRSGRRLDSLPGSDKRQYARSLRRLRAVPAHLVRPGHDHSFGQERLRHLIDDYLRSAAR